MSPEGPIRRRPSEWPKTWATEESFWRDVTTRTISALIVTLLLGAIGLVAAFFQRPDSFTLVMRFIVVLAPGSPLLFWTLKSYREREWGELTLALVGFSILSGPLMLVIVRIPLT